MQGLMDVLQYAGQNPLFLTAFIALVVLAAFYRAVKTDRGLHLLHDLAKSHLTQREFANVIRRIFNFAIILAVLATFLIGLWLYIYQIPPRTTDSQVRARRYLALAHTLTMVQAVAMAQGKVPFEYRSPNLYRDLRTMLLQEARLLGIQEIEAGLPENVGLLSSPEAERRLFDVLQNKIMAAVYADGQKYVDAFRVGAMLATAETALLLASPSDPEFVRFASEMDQLMSSAPDQGEKVAPAVLGLSRTEKTEVVQLVKESIAVKRAGVAIGSDVMGDLFVRFSSLVDAMKDGSPYLGSDRHFDRAKADQWTSRYLTNEHPAEVGQLLAIKSFIQAVKDGNAESVRSSLSSGVDPNSTDENGLPALAIAARRADVELVSLLLNSGADPEKEVAYADGRKMNLQLVVAAAEYLARIKAKADLKSLGLPTDDQAQARYMAIETLIDLNIKQKHAR